MDAGSSATRAAERGSDVERVAESLLAGAVGGSTAPRRRARFHTLRVARVRPLTDTAVEVTFAVPAELRGEYDYLAGQHVALRANVDGAELRRSYSICRAPVEGGASGAPEAATLSVAIKRDRGGRFSTWAQTALRVGDEVDVMSPQGTFTSTLAGLDGGHVAGIAAGSGITPLMALAEAVLARSGTSRFTLVYTNRSSLDVMFVEELSDLKDRYPTRLALHHVLSREQRTAPLLSGRLDAARLRRIVDDLVLPETVDEWFLCGPLELVTLCRDTLAEVGVDSAHVRHELFTTGEAPRSEPGAGAVVVIDDDEPVRRIEFTLDGQSSTVDSPLAANESILNAALRVRPDVPFACAGGVCGTCRARLVTGSVTMTENYALEPDELDRGYVLTCQSHPTSDAVVVDYDV
ncbi:ring-1,2-phenylacetyl-CoA epoxidase subunit PaaE [Microbacterium terrae]|uniref:1,2-phenylacetyl-CoA epoxidase, subunit E n=1 Tax=Microbacterium terrae TaxID=69369 RepID=A0A0M2GZB9_9MICO|nr:1,2-phenylacetyl-CoA epoxidase subunit PaaE [Microbacterium terrae]KJL39474.1 1,2-phenylacetyl-CoA epoxidase, subunit E [Microbacterium terrae]MBP1078066.1 ring-1,2-phenylacetyl-CoA epoxidase subunit PaaE [Microbacterium terrae]GLK00235.1 phenylacetic acid degradation protein [Microbacterium terrae]